MHTHRKPAATPIAIERALNTLLERPMFPRTLGTQQSHGRWHDDTDGEHGKEHQVVVHISVDSDAWLIVGGCSLRFREPFGGGLSPRTRNALLVLAEAMRRDNEEFPMLAHLSQSG